ncbi:helix-turn-helix domain-containing protein [Cognataquiflexum aquatile]|uniref:helix-turn-helix domain-containing protein n=1 Tax=Cognataquiflexum aquatile TaxID=2249427 RepID=UPI000DEB7350|nr:helix-turn-helix domain-containing protein [Cognataquiflexum aquatile]
MKNADFIGIKVRKSDIIDTITIMETTAMSGVEVDLGSILAEKNMAPRTYYYAFKKVTGESPKRYIKNFKIKKVRDLLISSSPKEITVQEIASKYGFTHMGQFGVDYKMLFGELPSETLHKIQ